MLDSAALIISTGCVAWALGITVLLLTDGLRRDQPWSSIPALIGALAFKGRLSLFAYAQLEAVLLTL